MSWQATSFPIPSTPSQNRMFSLLAHAFSLRTTSAGAIQRYAILFSLLGFILQRGSLSQWHQQSKPRADGKCRFFFRGQVEILPFDGTHHRAGEPLKQKGAALTRAIDLGDLTGNRLQSYAIHRHRNSAREKSRDRGHRQSIFCVGRLAWEGH